VLKNFIFYGSIFLGAFIAPIIGMGLVGWFLDPYHEVSSTARYQSSVEEVWEVISDFEKSAEWRESVEAVKKGGIEDGHQIWVEVHGPREIPLAVTAFEPNRRFVMETARDDMPFSGSWTFEVREDGRGSALTITERATIGNPVFRFMSRYFLGHHTSVDTYHQDLARRLGQSVEPVHH